MKNETKAVIFLLIWESFFYVGVIFQLVADSTFGWYLFVLVSAVQATILYYDDKMSKLERELKRTRRRFRKQAAEYSEFVHTHTSKPAGVIDIRNRKKIHKVS